MIPRAKIPILPRAPPVNMVSIPPIPDCACSMKSLKATPSIPGTGMKVPKRYTINKPSVNNMRLRSSVALPKADQLVFAAICSTADTIYFSLFNDIVPVTISSTLKSDRQDLPGLV